MQNIHIISTKAITIETLYEIVNEQKKLSLSDEVVFAIEKCRTYLDEKMKTQKEAIYGINTGFGSLYNVKIQNEQLTQLQENLVMSHACGTGDEVSKEIVKLMILLKIQSLSYGHSGVQLVTVKRLIELYNDDIIPVVYEQGSLGASGDLSPLAHMSLPLIGKGKVDWNGERISGEELLNRKGWEKLQLASKEGLALLNGTQFMSAHGTYAILKAYKLSYLADLIGAISLEGFDGRIEPFDELVHMVRPHNGQIKTASRIKEMLDGSELITRAKVHVQDPYSFRCMPQVHGASKDALDYVKRTFITEINSVTDNPNIFVDSDKIISGGNFHGQPLALALDFMAIALSELGSISERRTYQLISGLRKLPPFLVADPGLNSGLMIPQYTAASIASQNKQLCTPASVDSIVSSNGQEDHVSMGANAATKVIKVLDNIERILAIELLNATQALKFREPDNTSEFLKGFVELYRTEVPFVEIDRELHIDIEKSVQFISNLEVDTDLIF